MFQTNNIPKILAHSSSIKHGNFITPEYIISNNGMLLKRFCPHRMYPLGNTGSIIKENIICNFHGFEWNKSGNPINNNKSLHCGEATIGRSGLIFKNFIEPKNKWVDDIANENNLEFSHVVEGTSSGSWLWMMEIQTDLLHIRKGIDVVHPKLANVTNLDEIGMYDGKGWILQTCSTGWWLFIYPFTFIEWSKGCLSINYTTPNNINDEYGFSWITQFYYDPNTGDEKRSEFETLEDVFREDVSAIELQKGPYFPIINPHNRLENHCVHFGKWVKENRIKSDQ